MLAEYGTLAIFAALDGIMELGRRHWNLPQAANVAVLITEGVTAMVMILPKTIRAIGDVLQVIGMTYHDVVHVFKHGSKRGEGK